MCAEQVTFDTQTIRPVLARAGLECPSIDGEALRALIAYATERNFGLGATEQDRATARRVA